MDVRTAPDSRPSLSVRIGDLEVVLPDRTAPVEVARALDEVDCALGLYRLGFLR